MAWENYQLEEQRLQVVQAYVSGHSSMTDICKQYGISRKTAYKWCQRFLEQGEEGLKDLSKARHVSNNYYTAEQIDRAIDFKLRHRNWGPKKILVKLKEKYPYEREYQIVDAAAKFRPHGPLPFGRSENQPDRLPNAVFVSRRYDLPRAIGFDRKAPAGSQEGVGHTLSR